MNYLLTVKKDRLLKRPDLIFFTGNAQSYTITFDFDAEWDGLLKFATFTDGGGQTYVVGIEENAVSVPAEILEKAGDCSVGVWATNAEESIRRISTNLIDFRVEQGAYSAGLAAVEKTPDVWEVLFGNSVPKIIDGYWHIFDISKNDYVTTGIRAVGEKPKKLVDYYTEADKAELISDIEERIIGDIDAALNSILDIQNNLIGGGGV